MYLESLELQGFKSFPDKIKLEFGKGLTAIVGPNGSGKSNISDAVRWVLGEQSSKTLRGAKMEDIIFSGTVMRKPVGFAAVTLNIINNKGILQIPSEQVSITRRLYRSGDSEYLINGAQVRLKDIYELFMDTGLGRDGYSIIGQGRVAEIVSAKSNERREIFEEAAGISKFRYKKAEAERRLSQAEDNLLRLRDILNELEGRVEPLRIQSEKAAKFIEYSETKKTLEITVWVKQIEDYRSSLNNLAEKILISSNEYNAVEADINRLENSVNALYEDIQKNTLYIEQLREKILNSERANTALHADIAVYENDISHCKEAIADIIKQQEIAGNTGQENRHIIEKKLTLIKDIEDKSAETVFEYNNASRQFETLLKEQDKFESGFSEVNNTLNKLYIKRSELNTIISSCESNTADTLEQIEFSAIQNENLRTAYEDLVREKAETADGITVIDDKTSELNNRLEGLLKLFSGRAEKLGLSKKELEDINFSIRDKEQRIRMLNDLENSMEGISGSAKQVLAAGRSGRISGIHGSVAQLISVESKYSIAVETALGAAMQNIVVADDNTAKRCIDFLKETKAGRATFLPVTNIKGSRLSENGLDSMQGFIALAADIVSYAPEYRGIFTSVLGRTVIAEDLNTANVIAKKYGFRFKIVTLDGQVINAGGSFTGGSVSKTSGVLTRRNDIERLKSESEQLNFKLSEVKRICDKLQAETDKLGFDIEGVKEELNITASDKIRFESEIKRIEVMLTQTQVQINESGAALKRLESKLETIRNGAKEASENLIQCEREIAENEALISESDEKKSELHNKREALSESMSALKLRELELSKDKEALLSEIRSLEQQCEAIGDNTARLTLALEEQNNIIIEKEKLIKERKEKLAGAGGEVNTLNEKIMQAQSEIRAMEQKSNEQRVLIREQGDIKEKYSREITRLEERKISVQNACDTIIKNMSEQYDMYLSEALEIAKPIDDLLMVQRELTEITQKIRALGNVNVAAIEEYKEVSERYNFLSEQVSDAENAKRELERLITELTDDMRRRFTESFSLINENFKQIFIELFGGGRAELSLTDPEDVLESGIEIRVAPPGKVINNLSLLSGGEQAFVAIAIYFAILKIKPAPFCILDEIEAALDDVNVSKYARYLRNFTDTTQFILVTHRRGTMDEADVMYGVTMQEKGISRMLRLEQPSDAVVD